MANICYCQGGREFVSLYRTPAITIHQEAPLRGWEEGRCPPPFPFVLVPGMPVEAAVAVPVVPGRCTSYTILSLHQYEPEPGANTYPQAYPPGSCSIFLSWEEGIGLFGLRFNIPLPLNFHPHRKQKTQAGSIKTPGFVCGAAMPHNRKEYITLPGRLLQILATRSLSIRCGGAKKRACDFYPPSFATFIPPPLRLLSPLPLGGFWKAPSLLLGGIGILLLNKRREG